MNTADLVLIGEAAGVAVVLFVVGLSKALYWWQWGAVTPFAEDDDTGRHRYSDTPWWSRGHKGRKPLDPNRRAHNDAEQPDEATTTGRRVQA